MRLLGVDVVFERSWLLAAAGGTVAFAWSLAALLPETTRAGALLVGAAVTVGLTASILAHEFAHARVAMKAGIEIEHIRLFAGGAACKRRRPVEDAADQFRIAAAGPVASIGLGVVILNVAFVVEVLALSSAASAALWFVAFANCLIAISNLLPVFPFDGGKVVHALFWRSSGSPAAATKRLRQSGREFSRIVVALGFLTAAFAGDIVLGLGIAAFGLYLLTLPAP